MSFTALVSPIGEFYIATAPVLGIKSIKQKLGERGKIMSEQLSASRPAMLGSTPPQDAATVEIVVEKTYTDTTGQGVLDAAFASGAVTASGKYYPDGKSTGAKVFSGSFYVLSAPDLGNDSNTKPTRTGTYVIAWLAEPSVGVEP